MLRSFVVCARHETTNIPNVFEWLGTTVERHTQNNLSKTSRTTNAEPTLSVRQVGMAWCVPTIVHIVHSTLTTSFIARRNVNAKRNRCSRRWAEPKNAN